MPSEETDAFLAPKRRHTVRRAAVEHGRAGPPNGNAAHDGAIVTERPDEMWGTDATRFYTEEDGWCWWFGA